MDSPRSPQHSALPKFSFKLAAFLFLSLVTALITVLTFIANERKHQVDDIHLHLVTLSHQIEESIDTRVFLLSELVRRLKNNPDIRQQEFEHVARDMFAHHTGIRSLQLAKNNIVSHIYPFTGNKAALGHDLLADPQRSEAVKAAIVSRQITADGPVTLRQGGKGIIFRQPLFFPSGNNDGESYWGLAVLIIDWEVLMQESGIIGLSDQFPIGLRTRQPIGQWSPAVFGHNDTFEGEGISLDLSIHNAHWQLVAKYDSLTLVTIKYTVIGIFVLGLILIFERSSTRRHSAWNATAELSIGALVLLCTSILGYMYYEAKNLQRQQLSRDTLATQMSLRTRLKENEDYFLLLAQSRSLGTLTSDNFHHRAAPYVNDHQELINITWVDGNYIITDVAPLQGNEQIIGLKVDLAEPQRASRLATELRKPVYTRPFGAIQGDASFEIWVPVFEDDRFLGLLTGVYSIPKLLQISALDKVRENNEIRVSIGNNQVIERTGIKGAPLSTLIKTMPLVPPGYDVTLELSPYEETIWTSERLAVAILLLTVSAATAWGIINLSRSFGTLEHKVQERTKELTESKDALEIANEALKTQEHRALLLKKVADTANTTNLISDILQVTIDAVCAYTKWPVGHAYKLTDDERDTLTSSSIWHLDSDTRFAAFKSATEQNLEGLPEQVYRSGEFSWVKDFQKNESTPRSKLPTNLGVKSGFAFTVSVQGKVKVVLEFFSIKQEDTANKALLDFVEDVSRQLSSFFERKDTLLALEQAKLKAEDANETNIAKSKDLEEANERLSYYATTDALTGLLNRRQFFDLSKHEISRSQRHSSPLTVLMLDLDYFKRVNDEYGHAAGDEVLFKVSNIIKQSTRGQDIAARLGGEEFCILLPETNLLSGMDLAERIRKNVSEEKIFIDEMVLSITLSVGVSQLNEGEVEINAAQKRADEALYQSKNSGRNRVSFVDSN